VLTVEQLPLREHWGLLARAGSEIGGQEYTFATNTALLHFRVSIFHMLDELLAWFGTRILDGFVT
jgi:hypothetical protein